MLPMSANECQQSRRFSAGAAPSEKDEPNDTLEFDEKDGVCAKPEQDRSRNDRPISRRIPLSDILRSVVGDLEHAVALEVSILVVVDRSTRITSSDWLSWITWFQSLLSWIGQRQHRYGGCHRHRAGRCFNPCCRGWVTATEAGNLPSPRRMGCFNPCCRGWVTATASASSLSFRLARFQSLLSWMGHRNTARCRVVIADYVFQSLLSWMGHRNAADPDITIADQAGFQSLLSWMGHRNQLERVRRTGRSGFNPCCRGSVTATAVWSMPVAPWSCFNPCCRGWVTATGFGAITSLARMTFQSLLSWMGHRNASASRGEAWDGGFNPCCRGWVTATRWTPSARDTARRAGFQSLLSWMGHRNPVVGRRHGRALPVSILVVVDGSPQPRAARTPDSCSSCFNPCCRGSVTATRIAVANPVNRAFQSLLSWMGHRNQGDGRGSTWTRGFQSLLSWMGHRNTAAHVGACGSGVSILVVVDGSPQLEQHPRTPNRPRRVSILVVVDGSPQPGRVAGHSEAERFQSLLSWMGHRNT